jgi:dipeptidyl aminopeptidase/acylaminoacyl peptidase
MSHATHVARPQALRLTPKDAVKRLGAANTSRPNITATKAIKVVNFKYGSVLPGDGARGLRHIARVATLLAAAIAMPALARPFTPQDLVSLARVGAPAVSPDGHWLVWDQRDIDLAKGRQHDGLWRLDLQRRDATPERFVARAGTEDSAPQFGPDGTLYFLSSRETGPTAVWRATMDGTAATQVTGNYNLSGFKLSPLGNGILVWADRPVGAISLTETDVSGPEKADEPRIYDHLFVRHWNRWTDGQRSQLFVIPLSHGRATGPGRPIEGGLVGDAPSKPFGGGEEIAWSKDGNTVYFALREAGRIEPLSMNFDLFAAPADGSARPVNLTTGNKAIDTLPAVSPNGRWLAWAATTRPGYDSDRKRLMLRDLASGKTRELTPGWDRSIDQLHWAADSTALYVTADERLDHPLFRVDVAAGAVHRLTEEGHVGTVQPLPQGGIVYTLDSLIAPPDLWQQDAQGLVTRLTAVNATALAGVDWPAITRFTFVGAQGDPVSGFALRPAGLARNAKAPVILLVHGGPQNSQRDGWSYLQNAAAWTGHGFAVVSIDFHGSTGYGQAFTDSIHRDWGGKPLVDLKLGLAAAIARFPFVDGSEVCAAGGSYGGYMMNWIEGHWPDRFRCLVEDDGVFDTRAMTYETDELRADEWDFGDQPYFQAPGEFEQWNPVNSVSRWKTPMLVVTGEKDFRSPATQAIAAFTALQLRGVPSRLLDFPDEGHWILKPKNSVVWYEQVFAWVDTYTRQPAQVSERSR